MRRPNLQTMLLTVALLVSSPLVMANPSLMSTLPEPVQRLVTPLCILAGVACLLMARRTWNARVVPILQGGSDSVESLASARMGVVLFALVGGLLLGLPTVMSLHG